MTKTTNKTKKSANSKKNEKPLKSEKKRILREKKIEGISDLRDESNREGIRIVLEVKRDASAKTILNKLYKFTELQKNFSSNIIVLHEGKPKILGLKNILEYFIEFRSEVIIRQKEYDLAKAKEREHILEGLMIAISHIDEIIKLIRSSKDSEEARVKLKSSYALSDNQAQAILDMQLRRLAALEREKLESEYNELIQKIAELIKILRTDSEVLKLIIDEQKELSKKFGDIRRTKIFSNLPGDISQEDTIVNEHTLITLTEKGYIKRVSYDINKTQGRGGIGKKIATTRDDDSVKHIIPCMTHDEILFFSNLGKVYSIKAFEIQESSPTAKGIPILNLINMQAGELITSILTRNNDGELSEEDINQEGTEISYKREKNKFKYLLMSTLKGIVKKTHIDEYTNIRSGGLIAIKLQEDDRLIWVRPTEGEQSVLLITKNAKAIHFKEEDVRKTGRSSQGVRGIRLKNDDAVISMDIVRPNENFVLTISENGFGKITEISNFAIQHRGGSGIFAAKVNSKTGKLVVGRVLDHPRKELMIVSKNGVAIKIDTDNLPLRGRQTSGVILIRLKAEDKVSAVAIV